VDNNIPKPFKKRQEIGRIKMTEANLELTEQLSETDATNEVDCSEEDGGTVEKGGGNSKSKALGGLSLGSRGKTNVTDVPDK
jgi:hypothetical protein